MHGVGRRRGTATATVEMPTPCMRAEHACISARGLAYQDLLSNIRPSWRIAKGVAKEGALLACRLLPFASTQYPSGSPQFDRWPSVDEMCVTCLRAVRDSDSSSSSLRLSSASVPTAPLAADSMKTAGAGLRTQ